MKGKAAFQNLRGAGKAALREKRVAVSTRVLERKKEPKPVIPASTLRSLTKTPSANRKKEAAKMKIEMDEVETGT